MSQNPYKKAVSLMFLTEEPEFRRKLRESICRMEETVRNLLQNQGALGQSTGATADLLNACQAKMSEEVTASKETATDINEATDEYPSSAITIEEQEKTMHLLERLRTLEAENSALALENEHQRKQYERCLDEVANQVVQALLTQKDLREECLKLRTRVFDLEQQNRTLNVLFQQRVRLASDSLLQKLHSRIVDLSSGDLFSNAERNRHPIKSKSTDTQIHEAHPNTPSNVSVLKCQSQLNLTVPSQLYPRSSCSSSELSISSACSEHSSGSYTWNEGRTCSKRSSLNWETRLSIGSSLPSNLSSPADELPPTREKESHILEGLKKLQKKKPFLEPPSIVSKWAYKDCMNSNEGIYSLGLRCRNRNKSKSQTPFKATNKTVCFDQTKPFEYDSDSHDDVEDDCTAIVINEVPSKDCKSFCKKLTHSISDSLFDWDHNVSERLTHLSSREKPEKLTSFVTSFQSSDKLCASNKLPAAKLQFNSTKLHYKDLTIQLSDTEDIEILDELQLENTEKRNSSELISSLLTDKQSVSHANPLSCKKTFFSSADKDEGHFSPCFDNNPETSNLLKDNCQATKFVKASSEECITIVFDAEDGQPIRFNSQQTASVTVSSNQISHPNASDGNCQQTVFAVEDTGLAPQGLITCQRGSDARNYTVLESLQGHMEQNPLEHPKVNKKTFSSIVHTDPEKSERPLSQHSLQQQTILKPACSTTYKSNCVPSHSIQKSHLTKIPNKGKSSSQKPCKINGSVSPSLPSPPGSLNQDKSPSAVKFSKYLKMPNVSINNGVKNDTNIPKGSSPLPQSSKIALYNETGKSHSGIVQGSLFSRKPMVDHGEQPTRDKYDGLESEEISSPSPPPPAPPGRSTSLLFRPNCEHSLNVTAKSEMPTPVDTDKNAPTCSSLKPLGITSAASPSAPLTKEAQNQQNQKSPAVADLSSSHHEKVALQNSAQQSQESNEISNDLTRMSFEKKSLKTNCANTSSMHIQPCPQAAAKMIRSLTCNHANQKDPSLQNTFSAKTEQLCENDLTIQCTPCNVLSASSQCHVPSKNELSAQPQHYQSPSISSDKQTIFSCFEEKNPKTRVPVGLKVFLKSPPLLRKSSTVAGKHEKDSVNIYSKGNVIQVKSGQIDASESIEPLEEPSSVVSNENKGDLKDAPVVKIGFPAELDSEMKYCRNTADGNDVNMEIKAFKRSISVNSKPYLKPALGMNGAKARSQSFSNQTGEKPSVSLVDGSGKVRTQIITNTTDRGNSLTRQNSTTAAEAMQTKPACSSSATQSPSNSPRTVDVSYARQVSNGSISSSSSHHSSPSKLPCRTPPKGDSQLSPLKCNGNQSPPQKETRSLPLSNRSSEKKTKQIPQKGKNVMLSGYESQSSPNMSSAENPCKSLSPSELNIAKVVKKQENLSKRPEIPDKVLIPPPVSETQCSIEAKVMLGIQENMQKVQGRDKVQVSETKQKTGPSIAKWFGFRKSKLPAPNSKMSDDSKSKDEKKVTKSGASSGIKQTKLDKKKDKRKNEKGCERENDVTKRDASYFKKLESDYPSKGSVFTRQETNYSRKISLTSKHQGPKDHNIPTKESTNDQFMQELLHRVDKKAAHQKENGSNHVSCRNMSKGNSHGSAFPSNSISVQANHGKNYKMKPPTEIQNEIHKELQIDSECVGSSNPHENYVELWQMSESSPGKLSDWQGLNYENQGNEKILSAKVEINTNPESAKEAITESTCQDQMIGSSCQMRTLDSGIGTFPLPDSANRATGRHITKTTSCLDYELSSSLEKIPHITNVSQKAKTLEREVPCSAECSSPRQDMIGHSASDPTMVAKPVQAFQSCLPKPSSAGFLVPKYKMQDHLNQGCTSTQFSNICKSEHCKSSERMRNLQQPGGSRSLSAQEQAMHLCSYSASSSDNETEAELGSTENGTGGEELFNKMKHNKNGSQQQHIDKPSCFGNQSRVFTFYQPNLYMHYGKEMPHFSVKQLHSDFSKDEKVDDIPSKIKQVGKEGSNSKLPIPPNVSMDKLNRMNLRIIEDKKCLSKPKPDKESVGKPEEVSPSSPEKTGVDNSESLSDSLYDSFSSCASQASNEV
ncbi:nck-associated protein 5 isoform X2 [Pristis pectinata]|uniref:nck-associated protein 5 isoform X2 n=1 Tax=Pristis pectinata TaxID=685728 RepID=UPI00223D723E|nr:nck-associated protein 5 isoform X2 [Pristis pectinata]